MREVKHLCISTYSGTHSFDSRNHDIKPYSSAHSRDIRKYKRPEVKLFFRPCQLSTGVPELSEIHIFVYSNLLVKVKSLCEVTLSNTKDLRRSSVSSLSTDARDEKLRVLSEISFCVCVLWCCCSHLWRRGVGLIFVSLSKQRNGTKSRDAEMQQQTVSQQLL